MKNGAFLCMILIIIAAMAGQSGAYSTLHVPSTYPTIQDAINASVNGDVVIVAPGTYTGNGNRDISVGKAITVRSEDPDDSVIVASTIIDCQGSSSESHQGFYLYSNCTIKGLTITNGYAEGPNQEDCCGGAIYCYHSSPTIEKCRIIDNTAIAGGGAIYARSSNISIIDCLITENKALYGEGGAISVISGSPTIMRCNIRANGNVSNNRGALYLESCAAKTVNCVFTENKSQSCIYCRLAGINYITNCTIVNNYPRAWGSGIDCRDGGNVIVTNCISRDNTDPSLPPNGGREIYLGSSSAVNYSNVEGGISGTGNIDADPLFLGADFYYLDSGSPCIDSGTNIPAGGLPVTDLDGNPRPIDGNNDGVNTADMGAYEFNSSLPVILCSPLAFTFYAVEGGANPDDQILSIRKGGGGVLVWNVSEDCTWLEAVPNSGQSSGEIDEVTVSIDSSGLSSGTYYSILAITAEGAVNNPQIIMVDLIVKRPEIKLSANEFEFFGNPFGPTPPGQILTIRNNSLGTLNWTIDCDCNWFWADPNTGCSTGELDEVVLGVNCTGLEMGEYNCILTVLDPNAVNSPQTVDITLHVSSDNLDGKLRVPSEYLNIQLAINYAQNGETIIVADGVYTGPGNRDIDFKGKAITVKSENGPENCIIDCDAAYEDNHRGFYFIHGEGRNSVLEGFTIANAYIAVMCEGGAGIYIQGSSPTIKDCVVFGNHAELLPESLCFCYGGGIYMGNESNPQFINCTIRNNSVGNWGYGGGIYCDSSSHVIIHNCLINGNSSLGSGGGVYCDISGILTMTICTIADNSALLEGGGIYIYNSPVQTITNSILWGNSPDQIYSMGGTNINVMYSDIQGGWVGTGNQNADPRFASGPSGDYYLSQIPAGQFPPSPCVNAGSDTGANFDMDEFSTRTDGVNDQEIVDMGYHYQAQLGNPDLDRDGDVDFLDFAILASQWDQIPGTPSADIAPVVRDYFVSMEDLIVITDNWLMGM